MDDRSFHGPMEENSDDTVEEEEEEEPEKEHEKDGISNVFEDK